MKKSKIITRSQIEEAISVLEGRAFDRGVGLALAEVHRYGAPDESVQMAANALGLTLEKYKEVGGEQYDARELKKAGVLKEPKPRSHYTKR